MLKRRFFALSLSCLLASTAGAQTTTMDFATLQPFSNHALVPQSFGDHAGLDVSSSTRVGFGNATTLCNDVHLWNAGYSDLAAAAFACQNGNVGEFSFLPGAGKNVTISSLSVGSWPSNGILGPPRNFTLNIFDSGFTSLFSFTGVITTTMVISPNVTSSGLLHMQWGTDWDTGINLITTDVADIRVTPPSTTVPEPSTVLLLSAGLAAVAAARKRSVTRT